MQPSEKIYDLQAESLWCSNGYTSTILDDIPGSYEVVVSLWYCSVRGHFWWENVCMGVFLTLLLFHQQAQPCQVWQLVCTSDKKQRFTTQWQWGHLLCSMANGKQHATSAVVNPFNIALDRTMLINLSSGLEMETPTKQVNLQKMTLLLQKSFFKNDFYYYPKSFLISFLERSITQRWWRESISQRKTAWPWLKSTETC